MDLGPIPTVALWLGVVAAIYLAVRMGHGRSSRGGESPGEYLDKVAEEVGLVRYGLLVAMIPVIDNRMPAELRENVYRVQTEAHDAELKWLESKGYLERRDDQLVPVVKFLKEWLSSHDDVVTLHLDALDPDQTDPDQTEGS